MSGIDTILQERFHNLAELIFHTGYTDTKAPERAMLLQDAMVTVYHFQGSTDGTIAVFYLPDHRETLTHQFMDATLGVGVESLEGGADGVYLEITNILLGHLTGLASESGGIVEISDPGVALPSLDFAEDAPGFLDGEGTLYAITPESGEKGMLVAWLHLDQAPVEQPKQKPKVLIVDDSPVMCAFLQKVFTEYGYEVAGVAGDGVEAIEKFESTQPDLVTLDIIMPKMKGTEVLERILAKKPDAKVVMASSVSDARTVMRCLKVGAKRYIIKPYDREAVIEAVEKAMGLSRSELEG